MLYSTMNVKTLKAIITSQREHLVKDFEELNRMQKEYSSRFKDKSTKKAIEDLSLGFSHSLASFAEENFVFSISSVNNSSNRVELPFAAEGVYLHVKNKKTGESRLLTAFYMGKLYRLWDAKEMEGILTKKGYVKFMGNMEKHRGRL